MKESVPMGMNRTGVQMSPLDTSAMESVPASAIPSTPGDDAAFAAARSEYIEEAEPLGSVPMPATVGGAVSTGVSLLTGHEPQMLLDKLGERLAFERTGTRLYDALITKYEAITQGTDVGSMTELALAEIREDEARHALLLVDAIESIGGDPTAQTPCADLVGVESMGLVQVLSDPRVSVTQSLHAILTAELSDNAGWETLIALAEDNQQTAMADEFRVALDEERRHLELVQTWIDEALLGAAQLHAHAATRGAGNSHTSPP